MTRLILFLGLAAAVALVLGPRRIRWVSGLIVGLAVLYAVLKVTGVIDAAFPRRLP